MSSIGVALVTGASRGIGRAIALRLAKDGFDVGINDLPTGSGREGLASLKAQIEDMGRRSTIVVGDVSVQAEVENMVSTVVKDLGRLDVMVANAGIIMMHYITETEVEEWDKVFAVNARGVFLCYKYAALQMIKQGQGGRIIGASSMVGRRGAPGTGAYSATKFAVRGLTQAAGPSDEYSFGPPKAQIQLAAELGRHGITVNSYCPGYIDTNLLKEISESLKVPLDEFSKSAGNRSAVGYIGKAEDIANTVSFLASKDAHFITGQGLGVDGGICFS